MGYKKNLLRLFKKIKLLILDVDGVLTRGEIIYDDRGRELKIFNVKDGLGIYALGGLGIKTVLLTAKKSRVLEKRAKDMRVAQVIGNVLPKHRALYDIMKKYKVKKEEICFVGDDLIDLELIKRVGLGVAVKDAVSPLKKSAKFITLKGGGEGAVREVIDLIIKAKNLEKRLDQWLKKPR